MDLGLSGKRCLVTGASKGIGRATAELLAAEGARLLLVGRDRDGLAEAAPRDAEIFPADVTKPDAGERIVAACVERLGGIDVLVNNAGVGLFANVADMSVDDWRQVLQTNLDGVFFCTRAALPEMRRRGSGFIVNISSLAAKNAFAGGAAYCASKAALNHFSEALMQEVRHDNIRVSCVMPGSVATGFGGHQVSDAESWKLAPEDVARVVVDLISHDARSLPSRVELRPSRPPRKG